MKENENKNELFDYLQNKNRSRRLKKSDPEADDFRNLISFSLSTDTSLVEKNPEDPTSSFTRSC